jgi:hypothetical protein
MPSTSPIAQPVRQCSVALSATRVSALPRRRHLMMTVIVMLVVLVLVLVLGCCDGLHRFLHPASSVLVG